MSSNSGRSPGGSGVREEMGALLRDQDLMAHLYRSVEKGGLGFNEARDLVHDVIGDLFIGTLAYNPEAMTPQEYVLQCARRERWRRTRDQARLVPLWELTDDDTPALEPPSLAEVFEPRADPADLPALVAFVRRAGADDPDLLRLLTAFEDRASAGTALRKAQVIRATKLSPARYHNAQRRLRRLAGVAVASLEASTATTAAAVKATGKALSASCTDSRRRRRPRRDECERLQAR
jgi:hypothetical protein